MLPPPPPPPPDPMRNDQQGPSLSKRKIITSLGLTSGVLGAAALPPGWIKPVVNSVLLPAHAQTSDTVNTATSPQSTVEADTQTVQTQNTPVQQNTPTTNIHEEGHAECMPGDVLRPGDWRRVYTTNRSDFVYFNVRGIPTPPPVEYRPSCMKAIRESQNGIAPSPQAPFGWLIGRPANCVPENQEDYRARVDRERAVITQYNGWGALGKTGTGIIISEKGDADDVWTVTVLGSGTYDFEARKTTHAPDRSNWADDRWTIIKC